MGAYAFNDKKITFPGSHAQFPNAPNFIPVSTHSHQFVLKISNKKNTHIGRRPDGWRIRVHWQHEGWFRSCRRRMILILTTSDDDSNSLSKMESPAWVLCRWGVRIVHPPPLRRTPWNCGLGAMTRGHIVQPPPPRRTPWRRYARAQEDECALAYGRGCVSSGRRETSAPSPSVRS